MEKREEEKISGVMVLGVKHVILTRPVQALTLARVGVVCSWARHFTLTMALSTQVNK